MPKGEWRYLNIHNEGAGRSRAPDEYVLLVARPSGSVVKIPLDVEQASRLAVDAATTVAAMVRRKG